MAMLVSVCLHAQQTCIHQEDIASVTVVAGNDWRSLPIIRLDGGQSVDFGFDRFGHDFQRYQYKVEHCETDWSVSTGLFPTDVGDGFLADLDITDVEKSVNTNVLYTHYAFSLPNPQLRFKLGGNYKVTVYEAGSPDRIALVCYFMIVNPRVKASLTVSSNTDIDINRSHQQVAFSIDYASLPVSDPQRQFKTILLQNQRWDNAVMNARPAVSGAHMLLWEHCPELIFDGGNEYRKFEILDTDHPTMGVKEIGWNGDMVTADLWTDEPRPNYVFDVSGNGAFLIRNSDNLDVHTTADYVDVNFCLKSPFQKNPIYINANFTHGHFSPPYQMEYDAADRLYHATLRLKQGYYSYQYVEEDENGRMKPLPSEGNFHQTANRYQLLVYYRGLGGRTDELVGYAASQR